MNFPSKSDYVDYWYPQERSRVPQGAPSATGNQRHVFQTVGPVNLGARVTVCGAAKPQGFRMDGQWKQGDSLLHQAGRICDYMLWPILTLKMPCNSLDL